jgi:hypothetical protein
MAQHDYVIANQSGAAFRADLNNALAAIVSQNSGAAEPSVTYAYMPWADTTNGLFKIRNAANSGWITLYQLDGEWSTIALEDGTAAAPSLYFKDSGTDTGVYSPGADQVAIATGGVQRVNFSGSTEVVFNDGGADIDFRIEGDTKPNLFKVDAGNDAVSVDGVFTVTDNMLLTGTGAIDIPAGTTAQRPGTPSPGMIRYNTTTSAFEGYSSSAWNGLAGNGIVDSQLTGTTCKAWLNFNGTGTVAIRASFNVSSITDNGTGDYTVNFTTALADANYATIMSTGQRETAVADYGWSGGYNSTTTSTRLFTLGATGTPVDWQAVQIAVFR